jgi:hypothetical protein
MAPCGLKLSINEKDMLPPDFLLFRLTKESG